MGTRACPNAQIVLMVCDAGGTSLQDTLAKELNAKVMANGATVYPGTDNRPKDGENGWTNKPPK